jgi:hypothetical protein
VPGSVAGESSGWSRGDCSRRGRTTSAPVCVMEDLVDKLGVLKITSSCINDTRSGAGSLCMWKCSSICCDENPMDVKVGLPRTDY